MLLGRVCLHPGEVTVTSSTGGFPRFDPGLYSLALRLAGWEKLTLLHPRRCLWEPRLHEFPNFVQLLLRAGAFVPFPVQGSGMTRGGWDGVLRSRRRERGGCGKAWKTKPVVSSLLPGSQRFPEFPLHHYLLEKPHQVLSSLAFTYSEGWSSSPVGMG